MDPHKASHTAVAISPAELPLGELRVRASAAQAVRAGITKPVASRADPRTTMRQVTLARGSLDRHATYMVAAYLAGAAR